jgi:hypothetical protein
MRKSPQMRKSIISVPLERVEKAICMIRGEKVILDTDLARLYGVTTTRLNEQVKRNRQVSRGFCFSADQR